MSETVHRTPRRTCIACRTERDRCDLMRIVRSPDGIVAVDPTGRANGRGAWICASRACFDEARKRRRIGAALKTTLSDDDYDRLSRDFEAEIVRADAQ